MVGDYLFDGPIANLTASQILFGYNDFSITSKLNDNAVM